MHDEHNNQRVNMTPPQGSGVGLAWTCRGVTRGHDGTARDSPNLSAQIDYPYYVFVDSKLPGNSLWA